MIRVIDLVGYAAPMMVLLMTREMISHALGMLSRVAVVILSIVMCLLPVLLPHLILLAHEPTSAVGYTGRHLRRQRQAASRVASSERRLK